VNVCAICWGLPCVDYDDLGGISDVHIKSLLLRIEHRPPGLASHRDLCARRRLIDCDDGESAQPRGEQVMKYEEQRLLCRHGILRHLGDLAVPPRTSQEQAKRK